MTDSKESSVRITVALPLPLDHTFTYRVSAASASATRPGCRAVVPFGQRVLTGIIVDDPPEDLPVERLRSVIDLPDQNPLLPRDLLDLAKWISRYYFCSWGEALRAALPAGFLQSGLRVAKLIRTPFNEDPALNHTERLAVDILQQVKTITPEALAKQHGIPQAWQVLNRLEKRGLVEITKTLAKRGTGKQYRVVIRIAESHSAADLIKKAEEIARTAPRQAAILQILAKHDDRKWSVADLLAASQAGRTSLNALFESGVIHSEREEVKRYPTLEALTRRDCEPLPEPNTDQQNAIRAVSDSLATGKSRTFLLYGVTGSGKTLVYQKIIAKVLAQGGGVLVLIPEIALTPQLVSRFRADFGDCIGLQHSAMSSGERADVWRGIRAGEFPLVIGARSAVFAPLKNLKLIVVDEEGDASFKQREPNPRYNARDVALVRAHQSGAVTILGSATPSIESFYNAQRGRFTLLELPERVDGVPMPEIKFAPPAQKRGKIIGTALKNALLQRFEKGEQAILLHNRRGFFTYGYCPGCGHIIRCKNCEITMVFHRADDHLRCHVCGYRTEPLQRCPECNGEIKYLGTGTERVEEELGDLIAPEKIVRMDLDTASRRGAHHRILRDFAQEKYTVLLGTKMVAQGHDYPRVTLVGVVSADNELIFPDFRSDERAFALLLQAAGRAGRAADEDSPGKVLIQTWMPDHPVLRYVKDGDFKAFYEREIAIRRNLNYPPCGWMVLFVISSADETKAQATAQEFIRTAKRDIPEGEWLGPTPAFRARVKQRYRYQIVLKTSLHHRAIQSDIRKKLLRLTKQSRKSSIAGVQITVDVDPIQII